MMQPYNKRTIPTSCSNSQSEIQTQVVQFDPILARRREMSDSVSNPSRAAWFAGNAKAWEMMQIRVPCCPCAGNSFQVGLNQ